MCSCLVSCDLAAWGPPCRMRSHISRVSSQRQKTTVSLPPARARTTCCRSDYDVMAGAPLHDDAACMLAGRTMHPLLLHRQSRRSYTAWTARCRTCMTATWHSAWTARHLLQRILARLSANKTSPSVQTALDEILAAPGLAATIMAQACACTAMPHAGRPAACMQ